MTPVLIAAGLIGAMILAVMLVNGWLKWRKRLLMEAGRRIGLSHISEGMKVVIPLVPLIDRPGRKFSTLLVGTVQGYDAAFFDLYVTSGKYWNLQSAVLLRDPEAEMPLFQLRTPNWNQPYQRIRGEEADVPGREKEMRGLKLTSSAPDWARDTFSHISTEFLEKVRDGKWTVEGRENSVVMYRWGKRVSPWELEVYVRQAVELGGEMLAMCNTTINNKQQTTNEE